MIRERLSEFLREIDAVDCEFETELGAVRRRIAEKKRIALLGAVASQRGGDDIDPGDVS